MSPRIEPISTDDLLSSGAVTSTMTGGTHGRAEVPRLQKAAGVAHEAEQQLATFV
jgi:hypothetical protein